MKILFGEKTESISTKLHLNWMPRMNNRVTNNVETERVMLFSTASPLRLSVAKVKRICRGIYHVNDN